MLDKLTNQDLFILGCLLVLIALVGIVCLLMALATSDKKSKKNTRKVQEEKHADISVSLATNNIPEISKEAPKIEEILSKREEPKQEVKEEVKIEEPKVEEAKVEEVEIPVQPSQPQKSSIEDVLRLMNADLEKQKYETIDRYEEEQEENAVISYQELLDRKMALNEEKPEKKEEAFIPRFSNSEFISPIFGRVDKKEETQIEMLDEDFLNNLKEFRSNL